MIRTSRATRAEAGKALRRKLPRSAHARWAPPPDRPDPVTLLGEAARTLDPRLVPIRHARMARSAFFFLRGAGAVMTCDLASTPTTGLRAQLCGDAHLNNFGILATPERLEVFDVNDFDETLRGPWEWDVKRLAASIAVAGRDNGFSRPDIHRGIRRAVRTYREAMERYSTMRFLDIWYDHLDRRRIAEHVDRLTRREVAVDMRRARRRTSLRAFPKLARSVGNEFRIRDDPPLIFHDRRGGASAESAPLFARYVRSLPEERRTLLDRYRVVDVARKVVGVGSVGTACFVVLLMGDPDLEDPLFLQVKEARASVLEPYVGPSPYSNHAERVVTGQRLIQEASDVFLGFSRLGTRDVYVRQLRDMKFSPDVTVATPRSLAGKAALCGATLARAHARTGDAAAIAGYLGARPIFEEAIVQFAEAYADQTARDYRAFLRAIRSGRLPVGRAA